jgi:drug/metabolite transporter (DMT)-like permease
MQDKPATQDWLTFFGLIASWGSSFVMTKSAVASLDPVWIAGLRLAVAATILVPIAALAGPGFREVTPKVWVKFFWLGMIGSLIPFLLITWGTHFVPSGISGLLMAAIPFFVILLAHLFLADERLTRAKLIGFALGFAGVAVLVGPSAFGAAGFNPTAIKGELAILAGCLCYAVHSISAKRLGFEHPILQTASVCLFGGVIGVAIAFALKPDGLHGIPVSAFLNVAGLGLIPTAIAYLLMYRLMSRRGPSFVSYSNYFVPVYALIFGAAILGEKLEWITGLSLALILAGLAVSNGLKLRPSR